MHRCVHNHFAMLKRYSQKLVGGTKILLPCARCRVTRRALLSPMVRRGAVEKRSGKYSTLQAQPPSSLCFVKPTLTHFTSVLEPAPRASFRPPRCVWCPPATAPPAPCRGDVSSLCVVARRTRSVGGLAVVPRRETLFGCARACFAKLVLRPTRGRAPALSRPELAPTLYDPHTCPFAGCPGSNSRVSQRSSERGADISSLPISTSGLVCPPGQALACSGLFHIRFRTISPGVVRGSRARTASQASRTGR